MDIQSVQKYPPVHRPGWLAIASLTMGILSVGPLIFLLVSIIAPDFITNIYDQTPNGIKVIVVPYGYFGGLFVGIASIIAGGISYIRLIKSRRFDVIGMLVEIVGINLGIISLITNLFLIISDMLSPSCQCGG